MIIPFPVTITQVVTQLVLTERSDDEPWLLNVGRYNAPDDLEISAELALELLALQAAVKRRIHHRQLRRPEVKPCRTDSR